MFLHDLLHFGRKHADAAPPDQLLRWDESLSVGNALIDAEHKEIIASLNRLYDDWAHDRGRLNLGRELEELRKTVESHFDNEEEILARRHCPGLGEHAAEHRRLLTELNAVAAELGVRDRPHVEARLLRFIRKLVVGHVLVWDMDARDYLHS